MGGILKVVGTPIGNLGDLSPRVIESLVGAQLILAEDTRHSRPLLKRIDVDFTKTKLLSCNQHDELSRIPMVLERLAKGETVAIITDAGCPSISDPGGRLISAVAQAKEKVEVIPGPSAVIAALMGAGLNTHRFVFLGFLPKKGKERQRLITDSANMKMALVFYESPERIIGTLQELHELLGECPVVVARELTKQFETFHRGVLGQALSPPVVTKGEMVVVVEPPLENQAQDMSEQELVQMAKWLLAQGDRPKEVAKQIAEKTGMTTQAAYKWLLLNLS